MATNKIMCRTFFSYFFFLQLRDFKEFADVDTHSGFSVIEVTEKLLGEGLQLRKIGVTNKFPNEEFSPLVENDFVNTREIVR